MSTNRGDFDEHLVSALQGHGATPGELVRAFRSALSVAGTLQNVSLDPSGAPLSPLGADAESTGIADVRAIESALLDLGFLPDEIRVVDTGPLRPHVVTPRQVYVAYDAGQRPKPNDAAMTELKILYPRREVVACFSPAQGQHPLAELAPNDNGRLVPLEDIAASCPFTSVRTQDELRDNVRGTSTARSRRTRPTLRADRLERLRTVIENLNDYRSSRYYAPQVTSYPAWAIIKLGLYGSVLQQAVGGNGLGQAAAIVALVPMTALAARTFNRRVRELLAPERGQRAAIAQAPQPRVSPAGKPRNVPAITAAPEPRNLYAGRHRRS